MLLQKFSIFLCIFQTGNLNFFAILSPKFQDSYISKLAINSAPYQLKNMSAEKSKGLSSTIIEVMRILPPGYNISKIPKPVIDALFRGEVPDFTLLPSELQQHLLRDGHRLIAALSVDVSFHAKYLSCLDFIWNQFESHFSDII